MVLQKDVFGVKYSDNNNESIRLCFMSMPIWKLILLYFGTFGLYSFVWFYKYWETVKSDLFVSISPFFRTWFSIFTCFNLFAILNKNFKEHEKKGIPSVLFSLIIVMSIILSNFEDWCSFFYLLEIIPLVIIQRKTNKLNEQYYPRAVQNKWTWKTTGQYFLFLILFLIISYFYILLTEQI